MRKFWRFIFFKRLGTITFDLQTATACLRSFRTMSYTPRYFTRIILGLPTGTAHCHDVLPAQPSPNDVLFLEPVNTKETT